MTHKLYCYVDESGQDTRGDLFIVSVVIAAGDRDRLVRILETIEHETRKGRRKWAKVAYARRLAYIRRVLELPELEGKFNFVLHRHTRDYFALMVRTIADALIATGETDYKAIVLIDALPPAQVHLVSNLLRRSGVSTKKVRGVKEDESNALIRLADAICGFVRSAHESQPEMRDLFERAKRRGVIRDLSK